MYYSCCCQRCPFHTGQTHAFVFNVNVYEWHSLCNSHVFLSPQLQLGLKETQHPAEHVDFRNDVVSGIRTIGLITLNPSLVRQGFNIVRSPLSLKERLELKTLVVIRNLISGFSHLSAAWSVPCVCSSQQRWERGEMSRSLTTSVSSGKNNVSNSEFDLLTPQSQPMRQARYKKTERQDPSPGNAKEVARLFLVGLLRFSKFTDTHIVV